MTFAILWGSAMTLAATVVLWGWIRYREKPHLWNALYGLLFITVSAVLSQHALTAAHTLPQPTIHAQPDLTLLYLVIHYILVMGWFLGNLGLASFRLSSIWPALFLFSSYLYFRTFISVELGVAYPLLYLLGLGYVFWGPRRSAFFSLPDLPRSLSGSLAIFLFLGLASTIASLSPGESLSQYAQILYFSLLPLLMASDLSCANFWRRVAFWCVLLIGLPIVILAGIKFALLTWELGFKTALHYRLFVADVGPNWISYSLVALLPLSLAFLLTASSHQRKALWSIFVLGALLTIAYTQSDQGYSGWISLALSGSVFALLMLGTTFKRLWRQRPHLGWVSIFFSIGMMVALVWGGIGVARHINSYSLYARLYDWRVTLYQVTGQPWLGSGFNVRNAVAQYGDRVQWENYTTQFDGFLPYYDLSPLDQQLQLINHAHSIFLEIAAGTGIPALLAFLWFLGALLKYSLSALQQSSGQERVLIASCIAGIVASLGWGLIDVMEYSPPFFTTPVWILIGLLLAAPRAFNLQIANGKSSIAGHNQGGLRNKGNVGFYTLCLTIAIVAIILPMLGNFHYRRAYTAYQEHRWTIAAEELARASQWEPLNAKYYQLRAEALINMECYDEAITAYERAVELKRDFAPYHSQLGWLYWLQGNMRQATTHFQKAVEMDPREAWRDGLHADLALAYVAQGRIAEAIPLFKETLELDPNMAFAPGLVWLPVQGVEGTFDVVLDPVYFPSPRIERGTGGEGALRDRILAHLGKADSTPRLFAYDTRAESPLLFNTVLDDIEADYVSARAVGSREASRLLATVAIAARLAGLNNRAERTYLMFQEAYSKSAYGFRDLGNLYLEQGRLEEAQLMLEQAVEVSPGDTASWFELTEVYLDQGLWEEANEALNNIYRLAPLNSRLYELQSKLYQEQGEIILATEAMRKSLYIQESIPNRLTLANLYQQFKQPELATEQCIKAAESLLRTWPRPLDPQLWEIGLCLAQSDSDDIPNEIVAINREHPLTGNVLLGHFFRAREQFDQALTAYQTAANTRPGEGAPHYFLGETYQALGQPESAEVEYRKAAQFDPLESLTLLSLGKMQLALGEREAALGSFREAVELTPGWGDVHVALGNALLAIGDRDGATHHFQQAQFLEGDIRENIQYDFSTNLADADIKTPSPDYVINDYFTIVDFRKRVIFAHPDSRIRYTKEIMDDAKLAFDIGTSPESWTKEGDGVTFSVYIENDQGTDQIFSTYIDPKSKADDQRWHPHSLDLSPYADQMITIIFETGSGPAGDFRYDWAGWGEPRLLRP